MASVGLKRPAAERALMMEMGLPPQAVKDPGALILEDELQAVPIPPEAVVREGVQRVLRALNGAATHGFASSSLTSTEDWVRWAGDWKPTLLNGAEPAPAQSLRDTDGNGHMTSPTALK
jgi:hypothetical protein